MIAKTIVISGNFPIEGSSSHGSLSVYPFASDLAMKLEPVLTEPTRLEVRAISVASS